MTRLALHRTAAGPLDDLDRVPGQARIVDDRSAGATLEQRLGQQADQVIPLDEAPRLVKEEAAVEIAVPGDADVRACSSDRLGRDLPVLRQQRVGDATGDIAVGLVQHLDEVKREVRLEQIDHLPRPAVARIAHDRERFQQRTVDVAQLFQGLGHAPAHDAADALGMVEQDRLQHAAIGPAHRAPQGRDDGRILPLGPGHHHRLENAPPGAAVLLPVMPRETASAMPGLESRMSYPTATRFGCRKRA